MYNPVLKDSEQYVESGDLFIEWEMGFDNRKNGIISMFPIIKKITGYYNIITPTNDEDLEEKVEVNFDKDYEFICELEKEYSFGTPIIPISLEIDLKSKKITIQF